MSSLFRAKTTYDPIYSLLNANDNKERDELTQRWKDNKLSELSFVGIVVCFPFHILTGCDIITPRESRRGYSTSTGDSHNLHSPPVIEVS